MDRNSKLSDKEAALIAAAKRELAGGRDAAPPGSTPPAPRQTAPVAQAPAQAAPLPARTSPASPRQHALAKTAPAAVQPDTAADRAERMARLMADEASENRRRHKRLQMILVIIPLGLLILGFLWVLLSTLPRLR
jgi:hypothetical protein